MAGDGEEGSDDGDAMEASFSFPGGIALSYDSSEGLLEEERLVTEGAPTPFTDGEKTLHGFLIRNALAVGNDSSRVLYVVCSHSGCVMSK